MTAIRKPCAACPWRVDAHAQDIPNFKLELAEDLAASSPRERGNPEFGDPQFACHQSRPGEEIACAGWLASVGHAHPQVRIGVYQGRVDVAALLPGEDWPELHGSFAEVIAKLRDDCAS